MQSSNPSHSANTAKLAKIRRYITENFFRASKPLPQDDYFVSAAVTWQAVIDFIPVAMWDKCYEKALSDLPDGEFITAHRLKAAWPRVKEANTTNMFSVGVHYELRECPRCGRTFSGIIQANEDRIVSRRCSTSDPYCQPCPRYLLELHGVYGARLSLEQSHEVQRVVPEVPTSESLAWVKNNIRAGSGEMQDWQKKLVEAYT